MIVRAAAFCFCAENTLRVAATDAIAALLHHGR